MIFFSELGEDSYSVKYLTCQYVICIICVTYVPGAMSKHITSREINFPETNQQSPENNMPNYKLCTLSVKLKGIPQFS